MNKEIIENFMHEVWNKKNLDIIYELFTDDAIIHSPLGNFKTPKQMFETIQQWVTAIPDLHVENLVEPFGTLEDKSVVISHWKATGTHKHPINGIPAKGNNVQYQGVTMYRMESGKVVEYWAYIDNWTLESQMRR